MNKKIIFLFSLILVIFLSNRYLAYRQLGYREIPKTTDILDEKDYIWAAKSFLQTGIPTAWSTLEAYEKNKERKDIEIEGLSIKSRGEKPSLKNISKFDYPVAAVIEVDVGKGIEQISIVQPFMDHTFVAGLIFGLNIPNNIQSFTDIRPEQYRLMAIYVSVVTGLLLFLLTYLLDDNLLTAILSFVIYSIVCVFVLVSRYALIENLLIPLTLLSLLFIKLHEKPWLSEGYQKNLLLVFGGLSAGLAFSMKTLGVAAIIMGVLILLNRKTPYRKILFFFIPAILLGLIPYLYLFLIAPKLFWEVFIDNASRGFFGPLNFIYAFYRPHFTGFPLEGWWPFGFICLLFLAQKFPKNREIIIGFLSYLFVFLFFGGLNYPWYSLIFVPFIVIASAIFIKEMLLDPTVSRLIIFFLFPFSSNLYWGHHVFRQSSATALVYRIFIIAFLFLITLSVLKKKIPAAKLIITIILLIILWKMYQWNQYGFTYLIANWGNLPEGFFLELR